jgi:outer membrane protein assembly factor BamB
VLLVASGAFLAIPPGDSTGSFGAFPSAIEWSKEIPEGPTFPPVIAAGYVVVPLQSGAIIGRRLGDGAGGWAAKLEATNSLAAADDVVVVPAKGAVHGLEPETGRVKWTATVERLTAPPLVRGGWVILAAVEHLTALRAADGAVVWSRVIALIEQRPAIDGDVLYVPVADGRLLALELTSGTQRWEYRVGANPTEPLPFDDRVYLGADGKSFVCVKANGTEDWRFPVGAAIVGAPAADDLHVYTASMDNLLRAFRRSNGALDWKQDVGHRPTAGPVVTGAAVSVPGRTGKLKAFDTTTRRVVGELVLPHPAVTPPALSPPRNNITGKLAIIANDLGHPWLLILAAEPPPSVPVAPLSALPGTVLPSPRLPE